MILGASHLPWWRVKFTADGHSCEYTLRAASHEAVREYFLQRLPTAAILSIERVAAKPPSLGSLAPRRMTAKDEVTYQNC